MDTHLSSRYSVGLRRNRFNRSRNIARDARYPRTLLVRRLGREQDTVVMPNADLSQVLSELGLENAYHTLQTDWDRSQANFSEDNLFFLKPEYVRQSCGALRMSTEVSEVLLRSLTFFDRTPAARPLAWHFHFLLFGEEKRKPLRVLDWPMLPESLGEGALLFYAHVLLSGIPWVTSFHRDRGIPEKVTENTLADLELWIREYKRLHERWGLREFGWLYRHFLGRLYKLGRLQFEMSRFHVDFHGFRNRKDGRTIILAGKGMRFRGDGQFDDADGVQVPEEAWEAEFTKNGKAICGFRISPKGFAERNRIELCVDEWVEILRIGDPTLAIHIDASGPMEHEACGASIHQALDFFPKYFPEFLFRAFTCDSWLLDSQFEDHLPKTSNIVRFLRRFYLLPLQEANDRQTMERVFDGPIADLDSAPQKTSLQRAIIKHVRSGGHWRDAAGVIPVEDFASLPQPVCPEGPAYESVRGR